MRDTLVMADLLSSMDDASGALADLVNVGIRPTVLASRTGQVPAGLPDGVRLIAGEHERGTVAGTGPGADDLAPAPHLEKLLLKAARQGVDLDTAHFLGSTSEHSAAASAAGCRPVLVLGDRSLDDVFGAGEPAWKHAAVAQDLSTAVRYVIEEQDHAAALGHFEFGDGQHAPDSRRAVPTGRDLATLFGLVILAGVSVALGIAYFLRELYETLTLPAIAAPLPLQFMPEWARGLLFLFTGIGIGAAVSRTVSALRRRYR